MRRIAFLLIVIVTSGCSPKPDVWQNIFNGKDLSNWEVMNGTAQYKVEDGVIIGVSQLNTPNTFLTTKEFYSDFILELDVWSDPLLNSGIQIRSNSIPEYLNGRVHGYQIEIESSPRAYSGGIFDEARRGWLYPLSLNPLGQTAFKVNDWNTYRIQAIGSTITVWVNGVCTSRLNDELTSSGFIGLQVHGISNEEQDGKVIKWKNIRIATENLEALEEQAPTNVYELNLVPNTITDYEAQAGWDWYESGQNLNQFELSVEYNLDSGATGEIIYLSGEGIGSSFQIIDNQSKPDSSSWHGALKNKIAAVNISSDQMGKRYLKNAGSWNYARIVVNATKVEHWLNGFKIVEYDRSEAPESGEISLRGDGVEYRNAKLRKLN